MPKTPPRESKRHHYVPRFYMRRFASAADPNKVDCLFRHEPFIVSKPKSIALIGYEDDLHTLTTIAGRPSIEGDLNTGIETPLTQTSTWRKIEAGDVEALDEAEDKLNLFVLLRHLQTRNLENLRHIETELVRIRRDGFPADYSDDERAMYRSIARSPAGARGFFLQMALTPAAFLSQFDRCGMNILTSDLRLRTSSNPVLAVPQALGPVRLFGKVGTDFQCHWLPLTPHIGILLTVAAPEWGWSKTTLPADAARVLNQLYLVQLLDGLSVRYCFADDPHIESDLRWAGFDEIERRNGRFRARRRLGT